MRKVITCFGIALALGIASAGPGTAAEQTKEARADNQERRVCRELEITGKLATRKRVCRTQAEWDRSAQMYQDAIGMPNQTCAARGSGAMC